MNLMPNSHGSKLLPVCCVGYQLPLAIVEPCKTLT